MKKIFWFSIAVIIVSSVIFFAKYSESNRIDSSTSDMPLHQLLYKTTDKKELSIEGLNQFISYIEQLLADTKMNCDKKKSYLEKLNINTDQFDQPYYLSDNVLAEIEIKGFKEVFAMYLSSRDVTDYSSEYARLSDCLKSIETTTQEFVLIFKEVDLAFNLLTTAHKLNPCDHYSEALNKIQSFKKEYYSFLNFQLAYDAFFKGAMRALKTVSNRS